MSQSIPNLTIPLRAPRGDSYVLTARGSGFRPTFFARGVGVLNKRFSTVLKGTSRIDSKKPEVA